MLGVGFALSCEGTRPADVICLCVVKYSCFSEIVPNTPVSLLVPSRFFPCSVCAEGWGGGSRTGVFAGTQQRLQHLQYRCLHTHHVRCSLAVTAVFPRVPHGSVNIGELTLVGLYIERRETTKKPPKRTFTFSFPFLKHAMFAAPQPSIARLAKFRKLCSPSVTTNLQ